jgi:hypothetical protein
MKNQRLFQKKLNPVIILLLLLTKTITAQQSLPAPGDSLVSKPDNLYLQINDLSFVKNNEYFNLIADGYTLLGNKFHLDFLYRPHQNYQVTAGLMALKYYGQDVFTAAIPYFSLQINYGKSRFYIGKLVTGDRHHLSSHIYNFERLLDKRSIENGLQHRYKNRHWETDTWLDWEHFIQKNDTLRERLNFGQTTTYRYRFNNFELKIPLQVYLQHRGGQINIRKTENTLNNALVIANWSTGAALTKILKTGHKAGLQFQYYGYRLNTNNPEELIFTNGSAIDLGVYYRNKFWSVNINYWKSDCFIAPKGDDMFQSISRRINKYTDENGQIISVFEKHTESGRNLIYSNIRFGKEILKNLYLGFGIDMYYQLNESEINTPVYSSRVKNHLDYATGLYLTYSFRSKLIEIKP